MPVTISEDITGVASVNSGAIGGRRNIVINGAMKVAQRGTVTSVTGGTYGGPDRFRLDETGALVVTLSQDADVPTGQGFANSMKIDVTTADSSLAAGDLVYLGQRLEGQDLQQLKKGTSSAESVTLSFWVKTTITGTYIIQLYDQDNSRHISKSYTVSSTNTWEHKTLTFAGDTTGALDDDNLYSLQIYWWLAAGSNYTDGTLTTSWAAWNDGNAAVGQVNAVNSASNNIYITGVQLEIGATATDFEHRTFGDELALCQRYFSKSFAQGTAPVNQSSYTAGFSDATMGSNISTTASVGVINYPIIMRAAPTIAFYSAQGGGNDDGKWSTYDGADHVDGTAVASAYDNKFKVVVTVASGLTTGNGTLVQGNWTASAEL